ncbi:MAG: hypothetical protein IKN41_02025 [Candidatus Methanomethylophilaceae archaeon]|nr:hypothetical protein [Candidatus Methanomethylophilaceae archaeon]
MKNIRIIAIAILLIGVSLIGTGYAYQSSYESQSNIIEGQYVTLNEGVVSTSIMQYTQHYDTFVNGIDVTYSVPLEAGESRLKLTEDPFEITIKEKRENTGGYNLVVTSDLPTLFASGEKDSDSWCQFLFVLTDKDNKEYYGLTQLENGVAKSQYRFYEPDTGSDNPLGHKTGEAVLGKGTYKLDIYLVMNAEAVSFNGISGVPVDKELFVDKFETHDLTIRFTVIQCPSH